MEKYSRRGNKKKKKEGRQAYLNKKSNITLLHAILHAMLWK